MEKQRLIEEVKKDIHRGYTLEESQSLTSRINILEREVMVQNIEYRDLSMRYTVVCVICLLSMIFNLILIITWNY